MISNVATAATPRADEAHGATAGDAERLPTLRFITCGSVDDGKSTLIGRLLLDARQVMRDQIDGASTPAGALDLARFTDGLVAEREQGITIDVAWRYLRTPRRKFIVGDSPGHEQYTRNMVTAASRADVAVVLVDATRLIDPTRPTHTGRAVTLLPQTRRHALLAKWLGVRHLVFVVNKLDAFGPDAARVATSVREALEAFAGAAALPVHAVVPISALHGWNVVAPHPTDARWAGHDGPPLLTLLESLDLEALDAQAHRGAADDAFALPVQWIEVPVATPARTEPDRDSADDGSGRGREPGVAGGDDRHAGPTVARRIVWGRVATGHVARGDTVQVFPSGQRAVVAQVLDTVRRTRSADRPVGAGHSAGLILDRELDISRGDWLGGITTASPASGPHAQRGTAPAANDHFHDARDGRASDTVPPADTARPWTAQSTVDAEVAWLDDFTLEAPRVLWLLHGHRWVKARVLSVLDRLDIDALETAPATHLAANDIGRVRLQLQQALPLRRYTEAPVLGSAILIDPATNRTVGAVLVG